MEIKNKPTAPKGKLGILTPGMGAVATTFIAGVEAIRKKISEPIGSLTQMGTIRLGKRNENRVPSIREFIPLAELDDVVFGGWDIFEDNAYDAAIKAGVLSRELLDQVKPFLQKISPMKAVFDQHYVKKLSGSWVKKGKNWKDLAEQLMDDIRLFKEKEGCDRLVMIWCASTEVFMKPSRVHQDLKSFEKGLAERSPDIAPSMVYAYAALSLGIPFANGAPNLTVDIPALNELEGASREAALDALDQIAPRIDVHRALVRRVRGHAGHERRAHVAQRRVGGGAHQRDPPDRGGTEARLGVQPRTQVVRLGVQQAVRPATARRRAARAKHDGRPVGREATCRV